MKLLEYRLSLMTANELFYLVALLAPGMLLSILIMFTFAKGG